MDRKYYIKVNEYKSEVYTSKVGIPQGTVISPNLCNLYTSDVMEGIEGEHAEYADDNCVWENGEILVEEIVKMNKDLKIGLKWCRMWNMLIAPRGNEIKVHKDIEGNELADLRRRRRQRSCRVRYSNLTCPGQEGGCYGIKKGNAK